jgi:hypothetical protein
MTCKKDKLGMKTVPTGFELFCIIFTDEQIIVKSAAGHICHVYGGEKNNIIK